VLDIKYLIYSATEDVKQLIEIAAMTELGRYR